MNPETNTVPETKQSVFLKWGEDVAKEMSQKQMDMYKRYCEDREAKRREALEEDIKIRDLFLEAGRKAFTETAKSEGSLSPVDEEKKDK
jgi:hypothetical protein